MTATGRSRGRAVPGPRGSFLSGLARELKRDQLGTYERAMAEHGDVVRLDAGPPGLRLSLYLVTHPDGVQRVLSDGSDGYTKGTPFYREIAALLGDGLLTSEGARWRQQRRTLAPLFTPRRIARYVAAMAEEAERLAQRWTGSNAPVDLHDDMTEYTLRVVGRVLFGADVDDAVPVIRDVFPVLSADAWRRGVNPLRLPRRWPTPAQRRAAAAQRALYQVVDAIIDQRGRAPLDGDDLISLLLAARDPETGAPLSNHDIRDQIVIFLLAGHETTATTLTFALYLLGHHEEAQRRVQREADDVLGTSSPTADDVGRLGSTTMAIKEAMRLYPPAYATGRVAVSGDHIGGYDIPPNSAVLVSPWATHRRPDFWPDPERFDPERFCPEAGSAQHRYAYFPFGGGPRVCIGNHFAMAEAVIATAVLLRACTLRTDPAPVALTTGITLRPAGPVWCAVSARRSGVSAEAAAPPSPSQ